MKQPNTKCTLKLLDAVTGKIIQSIPNPDQLFYTYPKFYDNNKVITAVRNLTEKCRLQLSILIMEKQTILLRFLTMLLAFLFYFMTHFIFLIPTRKMMNYLLILFQIKNYGKLNMTRKKELVNINLRLMTENIIWTSFTAEGYRLKEVAKKEVQFEEMKPDYLDKNTSSFGITALQKTNSNLLYSVPNDTFAVTKYPKGFKLFNFHSIEPAAK